jgi:hypothetical protein
MNKIMADTRIARTRAIWGVIYALLYKSLQAAHAPLLLYATRDFAIVIICGAIIISAQQNALKNQLVVLMIQEVPYNQGIRCEIEWHQAGQRS